MARKNLDKDYAALYQFASAWVSTRMKPFTSDDLKKAFYDAENAPIENVKTVGAVIQSLLKEDSITKTKDFAASSEKKAKGRILRVFISKEYSKRQQNNRLAPYRDQKQLFSDESA